MQCGRHGIAVNDKSGEKQYDSSRQNADQKKQDQEEAQKTSAAALTCDALKFRTQLLGGWAVTAQCYLGRIRIPQEPPCQAMPA